MFKDKRIFIQILLLVLGMLSIPLIAMQVTQEVSWNPIDFFIAGLLLYSLLLTVHFIWINIKPTFSKAVAFLIVLILFLLLWAELAVGIFGSPFAGQ